MTPVMGQYIRPEVVAWAAFIFLVGLTFAGALIAVLPRNIIYNVFGLATSILGVAGLFIFLGSEFLAMMEILIYIGAISVTIPPTWRPKLNLSFAVSAAVFVSFSIIVVRTPWEEALQRSDDWTVLRLGQLLLTRTSFSSS